MGKTKFWKKGDKVVRLYGCNSWANPKAMKSGDVGTLAKDQEFPGVVTLVEYPDGVGHDVNRLRRIKDYKEVSASELVELWNLVENQDLDGLYKFLERKINQ